MTQDLHTALSKEFALFEKKFSELIQGDFPIIDPISGQIFKSRGKQLRPTLVFLIHKLFREEVDEQAYLSASLVEIVHAASLVHDDVVDMADMRRGNASVRAMFGNKTAVLAGDYLLANAFLKAYGQSDNRILCYLIDVIRQMSEGELLQLDFAEREDTGEEDYYRIIERKTASLFACCCRCGALAAGASEAEIELCAEIGKNTGMAFQIRDDLLDLSPDNQSGKGYGNDLREGKLTLPAIHMLKHAGEAEKKDFLQKRSLLREGAQNGAKPEATTALVDSLLAQIKASEGEDYARVQAKAFYEKAADAYRRLNRPSPLLDEFIRAVCGTSLSS